MRKKRKKKKKPKYVSKKKETPEERHQRALDIKEQIKAGTYNLEEKEDIFYGRLLDIMMEKPK